MHQVIASATRDWFQENTLNVRYALGMIRVSIHLRSFALIGEPILCWLVCLLSSWVSGNSAHAQCIDCEAHSAPISALSLAKNWDAILASSEFLLPSHGHFNLNRTETENFMLWSQYQNNIRALDCGPRSWIPNLRVDFQWTASPMRKREEVTVFDASLLSADKSVTQFLAGWMDSSANLDYEKAVQQCKDARDFKQCMNNLMYQAKKAVADDVRTEFNSMTDQELIGRIASQQAKPLSDGERSHLVTAIIIYRTLLAPNSTDAFTMLGKYRNALSTNDKIFIAQRLGAYFGEAYDFVRAAGDGPSIGRAIEADAIFDASRTNLLIGKRDLGAGKDGKRIFQPTTAGVCRDIAGAQGQVLRALGMPHTYVIGGLVPRGGHNWLYTEDPDDKTRSYLINYGDSSTTTGQTGSALFHPTRLFGQEMAMQYYIDEPSGKNIYTALSSTALTALEGFEGLESAQELSPGYRPKSQYLAKADFDLKNGGALRIFSSENGLGTHSIGVGTTFRFRVDSDLPTKLTTGIQVRTSPSPKNGETISSEEIFVHFEQRLQSGKIFFDPESFSYIKAYTSLGIQGLIGTVQNRSDVADSSYVSPGGQLWTGVEAHTGKPGDRVQANMTAKAELQIGPKDHRNEIKTLRPYFNQGVVQADVLWDLSNSAEGRQELAKSPIGQRFLSLKAAAILNTFGGSLVSEAALGWDQHQWRADVQVPFNSEMPLFLEGSIPSASATYQYSPSDSWDVWARVNSSLKKGYGPARLDLGTRIRLGN